LDGIRSQLVALFRAGSVIVDGIEYPLNITCGVTDVGFGDNLGFQFQLDNNSTGGTVSDAVYEWIDKVTLTVW
jgi:hypothetical protein